MRNVKFEIKKNSYDNDDIQYAFGNNGLSEKLKEIESIVAEVAGANDEDEWYWILKMKSGLFCWASGGCDYTGWDCQSHADISKEFSTAEEAIERLEIESYDKRPNIKLTLQKQITGEQPFALYQ